MSDEEPEFDVTTIDVEVPEDWRTAQVIRRTMPQVLQHEVTGTVAIVVSSVLADGTNFYGYAWVEGSRVARVGPITDWKPEVRFMRDLPEDETDVERIEEMWQLIVEGLLDAVQFAKDEWERQHGVDPMKPKPEGEGEADGPVS